MKVALLFGHFASNFGDVAITSASCSLLIDAVGKDNVRVIIPPLSPTAEKARAWLDSVHGTVDYHVVHDRLVDPLKGRSPEGPEAFDVFGEAILRPERFLERNGLDEADVLVFNSGEHLFSGGEAREDFVLAGRLALLLAGAAVGRKVICLPSTFGPFHSDFSSALARMFVKSCAAISVRESASLNSLHEIGIDPGLHNIPALLDPAFFLDVPEIRQAESDDPNLISVGIRLDGFGLRVGGQASSKALRSFRRAEFGDSQAFLFYTDFCCQILERSEQRIQCIIQTARDMEITQAVVNAVITRDPSALGRITIEEPPNLQEFVRLLSRGSVTVASRFHALIFSLLLGRPAFGVYFPTHGHKIPGLLNLFETPELAVDGSAENSQHAVSAVRSMLENRTALADAINRRRNELAEATRVWLSAALAAPTTQRKGGNSWLDALFRRFQRLNG